LYAALFAINYQLPLVDGNYTTRIWDWSRTALATGALAVLISNWRAIDLKYALVGSSLAFLSAFSDFLHDPSLGASMVEGAAVWLTFMGGVVLFKDLEISRVSAFQGPLRKIGGGLLFGIVVSVPLAVMNNLYFYMTSGAPQFQNVFRSGFAALSPAISEESIFRFFVLAFCLAMLKSSEHQRLAVATAIFLAVVPHSLNHLPDLFLTNAPMGLLLLAVTSLLFGLPMALLQLKRNFETAVAFHWFIDFARFLFGY
jgi:hypothetical protein